MSSGCINRARWIAVLALLVSVFAGCSPEPGTPEYVLAKLKQGRVVGGENLALLGLDQAAQLRALLDDRDAPRIARLQVLERLCEMHRDGDPAELSAYLGDPDPEVRMRVVQWYAALPGSVPAMPLLERFDAEREELVRDSLTRALHSLGIRTGAPPAEVLDRLEAGLAAAEGRRRVEWIRVMGGWHGERVQRLLIGLLDDPAPPIAVAAARSLQGPAVRPIERVGPIFISMLAHERPEIRRAGLAALEAATHPKGIAIVGECAEKPVLGLLEVVPELFQAVDDVLATPGLAKKDRKLAATLADCLAKFAPDRSDEGG